jgi:hypothetical protein
MATKAKLPLTGESEFPPIMPRGIGHKGSLGRLDGLRIRLQIPMCSTFSLLPVVT